MSGMLPNRRSRARGIGAGRGLPLVAVALACLLIIQPASGQETGTVTGVVSDVATGQLLESAVVRLDDAEGGRMTNAAGRYVISGITAGTHELTFRIIGYDDLTLSVEVLAGETVELNAELTAGALELQGLVVTGVARATPKVKVPFVIEKIDIDNIPVPANSVESFLTGKAPGVKVVRGGGQPGSTGDIMFRGATSISGGQAPLIIVDGIITTNAFDDLSTLDIESIEWVKGAAGASLYGSRAANGVIQIRTKRGSGFAGRDYSRMVMRTEMGQDRLQGSIQLSKNHPWRTNDAGNLIDVNGDVIEDITDPDATNPDLNGANVFTSFQDGEWPSDLPTFDHVKRIYQPGTLLLNYGAVEGRTGDTNYRTSLEWRQQGGVLPQYNDGFDRRGFRINLDHKVRDNLSVSLTTAYTQNEQEDLGSDPFYDLTFMGPYVDLLKRDSSTVGARHCPENGCLFVNPDPLSNQDNPLYHFELIDNRDWNRDTKAAGSAVWTPFSWLDVEGLLGIDNNNFRENNYSPPGRVTAEGTVVTGSLFRRHSERQAVNGELTASITKAFGDIATRTRLRYLQRTSHYERTDASGSDFIAADIPRLNNLNPDSYAAASLITDVREEGYFLISALEYKDKYILDGLARRDGSSLFGSEEQWHNYYRGALAWRLSREDWWPLASLLGEFKLRGSIGTAGRRPGFSAQYETYSVTGGTITPVSLGNKKLKPQRSTETELGVDMVLMNRASMSLTYANTVSEDQILTVPLAKAGGFTSQVQNAGTLESRTWEYHIESPIVDTEDVSWNVRLNLDRSRSEITALGRPAFRSGFFYYRDGEVFGSFYGAKWVSSCEELPSGSDCAKFRVNDDGLLVWTDGKDYTVGQDSSLWGTTSANKQVGNAETAGDAYQWGMPIRAWGGEGCETRRQGAPGCKDFLYLDNTTPDLNFSFRSSFRWKDLSIYALFDGERGAFIYNQTRQWAYRENRSGDQDQAGKDGGLKKPVAYYQRLYNTNAMNGWFVEKGDFVKLRELSIRYALNPSWLDAIFRGRVTGADINLIGRNLYTFTNYTGYDPEVGNGNGGSDVIGRIDSYQYPNYRTISASLQLIF